MIGVQERYILAFGKKKFLDMEIERREQAFLKRKNRPEKSLLDIEDEQEYDALTAEFFASLPPEYESMYRSFSEQLADAERSLIKYGLELAPAGIRSELSYGIKTGQIKQEFLQAVLNFGGGVTA